MGGVGSGQFGPFITFNIFKSKQTIMDKLASSTMVGLSHIVIGVVRCGVVWCGEALRLQQNKTTSNKMVSHGRTKKKTMAYVCLQFQEISHDPLSIEEPILHL
ncbi:hypothetical protein VNO77_10904 [Canavalia gladiata]|uniref:Uncharacterized protein n=1 Tax=Canavalia gladiata TaxID=3824 RepID=A0AAN9MBE8_CANGL